jgi:hypothetical protein
LLLYFRKEFAAKEKLEIVQSERVASTRPSTNILEAKFCFFVRNNF